MMEKVSRRLNIVWVSSHFHLDGTGCRRLTSFPPSQLFPLGRSVRDGCQYVAIEALSSAVKLGCASFHLPPLMAAVNTRFFILFDL